jgi:hypothetical protein
MTLVRKLPVGWWVRGSGWQPTSGVLMHTLRRLERRGADATGEIQRRKPSAASPDSVAGQMFVLGAGTRLRLTGSLVVEDESGRVVAIFKPEPPEDGMGHRGALVARMSAVTERLSAAMVGKRVTSVAATTSLTFDVTLDDGTVVLLSADGARVCVLVQMPPPFDPVLVEVPRRPLASRVPLHGEQHS